MNRNILIAGGVIIVGGLLVGFLLTQGKREEKVAVAPQVEEEIGSISTQDLGLTLVARSDKRAVKFEITKITGIASIDYELSYLAKGDIPRGVIGQIDVKATDKKIASDYLDLGSCSRNVCKYDEGVSSVTLILKITTKDGKILQAEKELKL